MCTRCGYAAGDNNRCPHCGATARAEPRVDPSTHVARWVCVMCAGPRIPGGLGGTSGALALREARAFDRAALKSRLSSWAWGLLAIFTTLVTTASWKHLSVAWNLVFLATALVPAILAVSAHSRGKKRRTSGGEALERAWLAAAEEVARSSKTGITATELASRLSIDPARAEHLLTQLAVHDRTRIDIGDDAEVRYSAAPAALEGGVRVETEADVLARAEAEALADAGDTPTLESLEGARRRGEPR